MPAGEPGYDIISFSVPAGLFSSTQQQIIRLLAIQLARLFMGQNLAPDQYTREGRLVIAETDEKGRPAEITITLTLGLLYDDEGAPE
jgi:hypothetical protein